MTTRKQQPRPRGGHTIPAATPKGAPTAPAVRTARNTRQDPITGTVAQVTATQPPQPPTGQIALPVPSLVDTRFSDRFVIDAMTFIERTGIVEFIDERYQTQKAKPGRPALVSPRALLVAMHLAVRDSRPLLMTELRDVLYLRLSYEMQRRLALKHDPKPTNTHEARLWDERTSAAVRRAFHRLIAPIDPSTLPKNKVRAWADIEPLKRQLSSQQQQELIGALDWVCNQLLEAAYHQLPEPVRHRIQQGKPGYCIDGTVIPLFARGKGIDNPIASADPDGGFYVREGDHRDPQDTTDPNNRTFKRTTSKVIWGMEAHPLVLTDWTHEDRLYHPSLPLSFTLGRPGVDPAGAARRVFASLTSRGHRPGWLAGDILYTNQDAAKYQIPARETGHDLVLGYGINQLGQQGAHSSGMVLIEGQYHAPCIPDDLRDATLALREKRITLADYKAKIKARVEFRMRNKETAKDGVKERLNCPAAGVHPTAICALKPKSQQPRPTMQPNGMKHDLRRQINHLPVLTNGQPPAVCQQETVTVTIEDGAKYRQTLPFGSDDHATIYNRLRQAQEGVHGTAKDEAGVALANPGRRRIRGWAATQLFTAFLLAETATRRILAFLRDHELDENGDMYVPRRARTGNHSPTYMPPGGALAGDDPPEAA